MRRRLFSNSDLIQKMTAEFFDSNNLDNIVFAAEHTEVIEDPKSLFSL
jgi:hypothetical protein